MNVDVQDLDTIRFRKILTPEEIWWIFTRRKVCRKCGHRDIFHHDIDLRYILCAVPDCDCKGGGE